jgi:hypothetical protein
MKITLGSFQLFSKIRGDICKSKCTNDTSGKCMLTLVFKKIQNGPDGILTGMGEADSLKNLKSTNFLALSL